MGTAEDEIRVDAEDALAEFDGLEVRRMFSGWGFYRYGLLFGAAWHGDFCFRSRQDGHWLYTPVSRDLLDDPPALMTQAKRALSALEGLPKKQGR